MPNYMQWSAPEEEDFEYAPGQFVRVSPIEPEDLIDGGVLAFVDSLSSEVTERHIEPSKSRGRVPQDRKPKQLTKAQEEAQNKAAFDKMMQNPEDFKKTMYVVDRVLVMGVAQPALTSAYVPGGDVDGFKKLPMAGRNPAGVYTDFIPMNDRFVIFGKLLENVQGKQSFREGSEQGVGALAIESSDESSP